MARAKKAAEEPQVEQTTPGMPDMLDEVSAPKAEEIPDDADDEVEDEDDAAEVSEAAPAKKNTKKKAAEASAEKSDAPKKKRAGTMAKSGKRVMDESEMGDSGEGIHRVGKQAARKMYKQKNDVWVIDPNNPAELTEAEKLHDTYLDLVASYQSNTPREGEIMKVSYADSKGDSDEKNRIVVATVLYGGYQVVIPANHLFVLESKYVSDGNIAEAQHYYASLRIGAKIKFIVRGLDEANCVAYASRLLAMQEESRKHYVDLQSDGKPILTKDSLAEARIVYIAKTGIGVDVFGSETFIPASEISWLTSPDLQAEDYEIGDIIRVKILEVKPVDIKAGNYVYHLIDTSVSAKQAEADPTDKYFDYFNIGDKVMGEIVMVTERGYVVRLAGRRDALAGFKDSPILPVGTKVSVKIKKKLEDKKHIYCDIRQILKEPR